MAGKLRAKEIGDFLLVLLRVSHHLIGPCEVSRNLKVIDETHLPFVEKKIFF